MPHPPESPPTLDRLKLRLRAEPESVGARRALAQRYREMGNPDQAGRWGVLVDGFATDHELDRLARLLAASYLGPEELHRFFLLPEHDPLPQAVTSLMDGRVETYRARQRDRAALRRDGSRRGVASTFAGLAAAGSALVLFTGTLAIWLGAVDGRYELTFAARLVGFVALVLAGLAVSTYGMTVFRSGERLVGGAIAVVATGLLVLLIVLAHSSRFQFVWDH